MKVKRVKSQGTLSKAVSNVKQIIKKKDAESKKTLVKAVKATKDKETKKLIKDRPFHSTRGIVYIGHIPHGFFENEMKEYFKQFGKVTRVRVVRSENTGNSRGYGYVEFKEPEVAKIAAETMNNYLMCGRLLKATYIPPEKQHYGFFAGKTAWTEKSYPRVINREKEIKKLNKPVTEEKYKKNVQKSLKRLSAVEEKLKKAGISVKFKPKDVPK